MPFPVVLVSAALAASPDSIKSELAEESGWTEVARKRHDAVGEIVVRHKNIAGIDCLEGVATTDAKVGKMLEAARDIDGCKAWSSANLADSRALSQGDTFDYYQVLDNPFPIKDRYWFLRGSTVRKGDVTEFQWWHIDPEAEHPAAIAGVKERFPDAVSTGTNVGAWVFEPDGGQTRVHYRLCSDPGGKVPDWAGHKAAEMSLPTNIADIVERAKGLR
jgi:hypothetical protein